MLFNQTLPFTSGIFFIYMLITLLAVWFCKTVFKERIALRYLIAASSLTYIVLLFPKPIHIIVLVLYLFVVLSLLRKYYKRENIIFPLLMLSLPIFAMKGIVFIPENHDSVTLRDYKDFVTIAGLSYMVFKVISLYIDERSSKEKINFLDFFNFTTFIPTLLIGPLDRFKRFVNDTKTGYQNINRTNLAKAWDRFILGLTFKFILAEAVGTFILIPLTDDGSFLYHTSYMFSYLFFLFFDFAGYSLLAISFGNFVGIEVPINFDKPFLARNPKEFWKRWHKSLGDWLNDYFFKPLFKWFTTKKISKSIQRQNISLFLTFTLMGFWNGFELHYIISGMLFGLYSVIHNYYVYKCKKNKSDVVFGNLKDGAIRIISISIMIVTVAFSIYIFSGKLI